MGLLLRRLKWFVLLTLLFGTIFGFYLFYLNYQITSKFEHHRWNLPSRIYSDVTFVYKGKALSPSRLENKLINLGYIRRPSPSIRSQGEYHRSTKGMIIYLHSFDYPHESFRGFPVFVSWQENTISQIERLDTKEMLTMFKLEPERIASFFDEKMEDRTLVALAKAPPVLIDALVSIEDERFFKHHGVDPLGIARALLTDLWEGRLAQGGSTLTQQLVKNFFLTNKKSFVRKFNELWMALLLERRYTKEEILEAYLNEIYLGQNGSASVTGVGEASHFYFAKDISQITVGEAALLAGMVQSPGTYSPFLHPDKAQKRRDTVLRALYEDKKISQKQYERSLKEKIIVPKRQTSVIQAPFFIDLVQLQLRENFLGRTLQEEGHSIFTTLDLDMQRQAEMALQQGLNSLEEKYKPLQDSVKAGKKLEGLIIAITPQTGYLRAYVGGRDYSTSQFNRPLLAFRQPGSAFKPFVYLAALDPNMVDKSFTVTSLIDDEPMTLDTPEGPWTPKNYDEESHGTVSLRTALEHSYNIATVRLATEVSLENVVTVAKRAGITSPIQPFPSTALGSFEVSPLELAEAYSIFPNGGTRSKILSIRHMITKEGQLLKTKDIKMKQAFDEDVIYLMNSLLQGVFERGTASSAKWYGFKGTAGGKTGTTSDYRDAWFVGYTPELLTLVWVGYDDGSPTGLAGAEAALPIWSAFMKEASPYEGPLAQPPSSIVFEDIDPLTGLQATSHCPFHFTEPFIKGTEPTETCPLH